MLLRENKATPSSANRFTVSSPTSAYATRLAETQEDLADDQRLRYRVFNKELNEWLYHSDALGRYVDVFDRVCDHLLVVESNAAQVVGTYRLQTGNSAAVNLGHYSEQ